MGTVMSTPIDYNAVSACAAVIAALTTVVALIVQGRRNHLFPKSEGDGFRTHS